MKYGIIGNCQYIGLVSSYGSVDWLCWPRFDSSFVFGRLLDKNSGGYFRLGPSEEIAGNQQYIENTNVLVTRFSSLKGSFEVIDFAPRFLRFHTFYRPNILIRILRPIDGTVLVQATCEPRYLYGEAILKPRKNPDAFIYEGAPENIFLKSDLPLYLIEESRPFLLDKTYYFILSWGIDIEGELRHTCESLLERTISYWQRWVKHCHLPRQFQKQVIRSALCLKLHQYEESGAIIAAATAGIPEAQGTDRIWDYRYCWLRDAHFTLMAFRRLGQFEEMEQFVTYLRNIIELSPSRLQPVYGVTGETRLTERVLSQLSGYKNHKPVRIGNQAFEHTQNDIYGEMIMAISPLYIDARFMGYLESKPRLLLNQLLKRIDQYLEEKDASLWEFRGSDALHTFSVLMHWSGAKCALEISIECGFDEEMALCLRIIERAKTILEGQCWNESIGAYVQSPQSNELDAALLQMINVGYLKQNDPKALLHTQAIRGQLATKGGLLRRYGHLDDFGETQNAFTICSFWLVEALAKLGKKDASREVWDILERGGNHLGLYSEDLNPITFEQWGNFPQAYSHVGQINAAFALSDPWE
jgi:GH15 family glucan-1,4-alpha-glucosidase